jgi:hypothetical protein
MMLVDQIRATTAEVVKKAKHVTIIPSKIPEIIKLLKEEEGISPFFDFDCHIDKSAPEEAITSKKKFPFSTIQTTCLYWTH